MYVDREHTLTHTQLNEQSQRRVAWGLGAVLFLTGMLMDMSP